MTISTITLSSDNGDSVVVSSPDGSYLTGDIILDTDPTGLYDTGFTLRMISGAFQPGARVVGETIPVREPVLPFHLTPESRPRFQKIWHTGNFRKVALQYETESGTRTLNVRLNKELTYTTEGGFDSRYDDYIHAVVSAIAPSPNYVGTNTVATWTNPDSRFTIVVTKTSGTFPLTRNGASTTAIAYNADPSVVQSALQTLIGSADVTVTGTAGSYTAAFTDGSAAALTSTSGVTVNAVANTGWFDVWNPTDQQIWLEWALDPATQWQFPDFSFGQERQWGRALGADAARMIVTPKLTQMLSVMSDPFQDTYVNADLSNAAGLFNGVEPVYAVPPYTASEADPVLVPVTCIGPSGAVVTLSQQQFWSSESGLE